MAALPAALRSRGASAGHRHRACGGDAGAPPTAPLPAASGGTATGVTEIALQPLDAAETARSRRAGGGARAGCRDGAAPLSRDGRDSALRGRDRARRHRRCATILSPGCPSARHAGCRRPAAPAAARVWRHRRAPRAAVARLREPAGACRRHWPRVHAGRSCCRGRQRRGERRQALDELWTKRIVREQGVNSYDFTHDKLREVAYAEISAPQRRLLHRRIAQAFEATYSGRSRSGERPDRLPLRARGHGRAGHPLLPAGGSGRPARLRERRRDRPAVAGLALLERLPTGMKRDTQELEPAPGAGADLARDQRLGRAGAGARARPRPGAVRQGRRRCAARASAQRAAIGLCGAEPGSNGSSTCPTSLTRCISARTARRRRSLRA